MVEKHYLNSYELNPHLIFADMEDAIMQGEIFGPILPIILYKKRDEIDSILGRYGKPLLGIILHRILNGIKS